MRTVKDEAPRTNEGAARPSGPFAIRTSLFALPRNILADCLLAVFLVLVAAAAGAFYLVLLPAPNLFELPSGHAVPNLATAVMIATGRGFVEPAHGNGAQNQYPEAPDLTRFLRRETMSLSPSQIPDDLDTCKPTSDWQYRHRYLFYTIGGLWRVFGISWNVVTGLRIALYCVMIAATFALLRLGMGRLLSAAGAFLLAVSPGMLVFSANVRDFSKGPFVLAAMLILGCLVKHAVTKRAFCAVAALLGLVVGFGVGFRADVLICLPAGLLVLAGCSRPDAGRPVLQRLAAMGLLAAAFLAASWPILSVYQNSGLFEHDVTMGLATKCDDYLGVGRASYERVYVNDDKVIAALQGGYAERTQPSGELWSLAAIRRGFLMGLVRTFPGDMLTRAYASVLHVLHGGHAGLLGNLQVLFRGPHMVVAAAAALLLMAQRSLRLAWMTFLLLLYFCGYLCLQAEPRHGFHLAFVPIWITGFLLDKLAYAVEQARLPAVRQNVALFLSAPRRWWSPPPRRMLQFATGAAILLLAPLYAARALQGVEIGGLLDRYATAELEPVAVESRPLNDWILFQRSTLLASRARPRPGVGYTDEYWMAEFAPSAQWRPVWLQYERERGPMFSHGLWVCASGPNDSGALKYFFPVVERTEVMQGEWCLLAGIAVPREHAGDFRGLYRVRNAKDFPLFLNLSLPADRNAVYRYQTLFGRTPPGIDAEAARYWLEPNPLFDLPAVNSISAAASPSASVESYQTALATDPRNALLRLGLAVALETTGDRASALDAYREALATNPRCCVTYYYLDAFLKRQGDLNSRVAFWRDIAQEYPDVSLPYLQWAMALEETQEIDGAIGAYQRAADLDESDAGTFEDIGRLLTAKNDLDGAIQAYQRALQIDPTDRNASQELAQLLSRKGSR